MFLHPVFWGWHVLLTVVGKEKILPALPVVSTDKLLSFFYAGQYL